MERQPFDETQHLHCQPAYHPFGFNLDVEEHIESAILQDFLVPLDTRDAFEKAKAAAAAAEMALTEALKAKQLAEAALASYFAVSAHVNVISAPAGAVEAALIACAVEGHETKRKHPTAFPFKDGPLDLPTASNLHGHDTEAALVNCAVLAPATAAIGAEATAPPKASN